MKYQPGSGSYDFAKIGSDNSSIYRPKDPAPITVTQAPISYQPQNGTPFKLDGSGIRSNLSYVDTGSTQFGQPTSGSNSLSQSLVFQGANTASQPVAEKSYSGWGQAVQQQIKPIQIVGSQSHQPVPYAQASPWTGNSLSYQTSFQQGPQAVSQPLPQQTQTTQEWRPAPQAVQITNSSNYTASNSNHSSPGDYYKPGLKQEFPNNSISSISTVNQNQTYQPLYTGVSHHQPLSQVPHLNSSSHPSLPQQPGVYINHYLNNSANMPL